MHNRHFTEEHELFRQSLRAFLDAEVRPYLNEWEENHEVPKSVWKKMGNLGFLGLSYPEKYGGFGLDFFYDVVFNEEMGRLNSGGFAITQQVVQYMSSTYLNKYGSDVLKERFLPGIISGDLISAVGITEPNAGSDVRSITTNAREDGDDYIINGSKTFITNGMAADFIVTVVKLDINDPKSISLLLIETNREGVSRSKLKKLGWHASDTAEISFDDVRVPKSNLLGEVGRGFSYLMGGLQLERLIFVPYSVSAMETALEQTKQYVSERKAFGKPLNKLQVIRHSIAEMTAEVEALKAFGYHACSIYNEKIYDVKICSMAKLLATEKINELAGRCLQMFGGYGFMEEYPMARLYRDSRVLTIGAGTSEIMKEIIAKIVIDGVEYIPANV